MTQRPPAPAEAARPAVPPVVVRPPAPAADELVLPEAPAALLPAPPAEVAPAPAAAPEPAPPPAAAVAPAAAAFDPAAEPAAPDAGGVTGVPSQRVGVPPNIDDMHPSPIAELSMPQVCDDSMQQPDSAVKPGIEGAGHIALSGGGVHSPAVPTQPQPPAGKQHGTASAALGMNILI